MASETVIAAMRELRIVGTSTISDNTIYTLLTMLNYSTTSIKTFCLKITQKR
ncbi:hypothetical protein TUMSATVNIG1_59910 (plasmid) [Vibrio nigripulchritudo]|nr:hypothetical protein VNTUMSATTG_59420 [Vibrio nigripulchritudo]BDU35382.1 hypothetical protein TUMSATVNIG1_59910 [Vibrio nigripulchritudo]